MTQPLLLCWDGSDDSRHAVEVAARLLPGHDVVLVHVSKSFVDWGVGPKLGPLLAIPGVDDAILARAQSVLDDGVAFARERGFDVRGELRTTGSAVWRSVLDVAVDVDAAIIVAGARGERLRDQLGLGSVAQGLVGAARVPLLVTRRHDGERIDVTDGVDLLIGYDASELANRAIARAAELFAGARATVVTVWDASAGAQLVALPGLVMPIELGDDAPALRAAASDIAAAGEAAANAAGLRASGREVAAERGTGAALLECARASASDLIVVGTHGNGFIARALLGSVARYVVQRADRPVVVVPPLD